MDLDHDLGIKIPADLIIKEFECPVCFSTLNESIMTKCGHVFCKACIEECLNRRHECPNCKQATEAKDVIPNYTLDKIIKTVLDEKEKAAKEYYDSMCDVSKQVSNSTNPIEMVFKKNMQESFNEFERYFEDLRTRNNILKAKVKNQGLDAVETNAKLRELDEAFNTSCQMIVDSYDRHMKSISPSPDLLPLRLFLKVPKKNVIMDVYIPRTHTAFDLKQLIIEHFLSKGDQVIQISEGNFILHNNFKEDSISTLGQGPIGSYEIVSGNTIFFDGEIILKSDEPKECFTKGFIKATGMKTNYYSCTSCATNWICEPCAQSCHSGHSISSSVPNHEPTWACCYCVKKGLCKIPNNKKK